MRKIIYLDEAGRKKETEPLSAAQEIEFYQRLHRKETSYTVLNVVTV